VVVVVAAVVEIEIRAMIDVRIVHCLIHTALVVVVAVAVEAVIEIEAGKTIYTHTVP
jgi:hypothetical protein